jgi:hypothetical protein
MAKGTCKLCDVCAEYAIEMGSTWSIGRGEAWLAGAEAADFGGLEMESEEAGGREEGEGDVFGFAFDL